MCFNSEHSELQLSGSNDVANQRITGKAKVPTRDDTDCASTREDTDCVAIANPSELKIIESCDVANRQPSQGTNKRGH